MTNQETAATAPPQVIQRHCGFSLGVAFEIALATLRPPDSDPLREAVAWKIIELAKAGERDPERLCDGALKDLPPAVSVHSPKPASTASMARIVD
jgi:hypothetical protein